ncbi:MAG: HAD-IA family hydrolase [Caulobacteraceae bacterium]
MSKAVVFDLDGVIINSLQVQREAFFESYRKVVGEGSPSFEEFLSHSGDSLNNILRKMKLPLQMLDVYKEISNKRLHLVEVYDGITKLLETLRNEGYSCGLCTGKDRDRTLKILEHLGIRSCFDTIVCSDDVEYPKPHPQSLLLAINKLSVPTEKTVFVGDARNDILCAKAAGVKCIAVTWGDIKKEVLESELPDYIVDNVKELYDSITFICGMDKRKYLINDFVIAEENCNMKCEYCLTDVSQFRDNHSNMPKSSKALKYDENNKMKYDIDSISGILNDYFDIAILKVSGGELLMVKGILEYIKAQVSRYKVIQILTNGTLLNNELLRQLSELKNICLQVSIDHNSICGNRYRTRDIRLLNKILSNVDKAVEHGIPIEINCVLTDANTRHIDEFAEYLLKYKGKKVMLFPFPVRGPVRERYYPHPEDLPGIKALIDNYEKYRAILAPKIYLEYMLEFLKNGRRNLRCSLPDVSIGSFDDGTITPCPNYWFTVVGNLLEDDKSVVLSKIGKDKIYRVLTAPNNKLYECNKCFTPWDILNLFFINKIDLEELCRSPLYSFPEVMEYLIYLKKNVLEEMEYNNTYMRIV